MKAYFVPYMHHLILITFKINYYLYFNGKYTEAGKIKWRPTDD